MRLILCGIPSGIYTSNALYVFKKHYSEVYREDVDIESLSKSIDLLECHGIFVQNENQGENDAEDLYILKKFLQYIGAIFAERHDYKLSELGFVTAIINLTLPQFRFDMMARLMLTSSYGSLERCFDRAKDIIEDDHNIYKECSGLF